MTNLRKVPLEDPRNRDEVRHIGRWASRTRATHATEMNAVSSRSHALFTLYISGSNGDSRIAGALHLVDLAGSERLSRSGATGERLRETRSINKSLSCLTDVFTAIGSGASHVPFRNSKLTTILQPALSGDGKTLMLANLSPTAASQGESLCTLRFAAGVNSCELGRAKKHVTVGTDAPPRPARSARSSRRASLA